MCVKTNISKIKKATAKVKEKLTALTAEADRILEQNVLLRMLINSGVAYVVDVESDMIILTNDKLKEEFGDIEGRVCYEVLQGRSERCPYCPNKFMEDAVEPLIWGHLNEVNNKVYVASDQFGKIRINGKEVLLRFELAFVLNEESKQSIDAAWEKKKLNK